MKMSSYIRDIRNEIESLLQMNKQDKKIRHTYLKKIRHTYLKPHEQAPFPGESEETMINQIVSQSPASLKSKVAFIKKKGWLVEKVDPKK